MKKILLLLCLLTSAFAVNAQNIGINNPNPQFPLSFNGALGDKISLWTDGTPTHYGFGIKESLFQIFSKTSTDDIAFGYGNSDSFIERMRIKNGGEWGMELSGRVLLKNGTFPLDLNFSPGIWLNKADNSGMLGFIGTQNNQNMGFYGGPSGWGFTYDAVNSLVGIGTSTPNASALLDISSSTKGFLPPRMTIAQRNAIATPAAGLIVHCTNCTPVGPYSYNGASWSSMTSSATTISYTIGQPAHGGIVFWVDETGQHGLVAATADQHAGILWQNILYYLNTKAVREGIYGGAYNTDRINETQGTGSYASVICAVYAGGGYGDWYLPSKDELKIMFQNIYTGNGFFLNENYWSSTEQLVATGATCFNAWYQTATPGNAIIQAGSKNTVCRVRAIRRF